MKIGFIVQFRRHFGHFHNVFDEQLHARGQRFVLFVRLGSQVFESLFQSLRVSEDAVEELLPNPVGARLEVSREAGDPLLRRTVDERRPKLPQGLTRQRLGTAGADGSIDILFMRWSDS